MSSTDDLRGDQKLSGQKLGWCGMQVRVLHGRLAGKSPATFLIDENTVQAFWFLFNATYAYIALNGRAYKSKRGSNPR